MAILKWLRKHMRITPQMHEDKFFVRQNGVLVGNASLFGVDLG